MGKIDFEQLINNQNARVVIDIGRGGGRPIVGFMQSEISVNGSNEFNTLFDTSTQESITTLTNKARQIAQSGRVQQFIQDSPAQVEDLRNVSLINVAQTIQEWTASTRPTFSINILFIAIRNGDDVRVPATKLLSTVYPNKTTGGFLSAPNNLTPTAPNRPGVGAVEIGKWFRAPGIIFKEVNNTFSNQVIRLDSEGSDTAPLYCISTIQFQPFRQPTFSEISKYLKQTPSNVFGNSLYEKDKTGETRAQRAVNQEAGSGSVSGNLTG